MRRAIGMLLSYNPHAQSVRHHRQLKALAHLPSPNASRRCISPTYGRGSSPRPAIRTRPTLLATFVRDSAHVPAGTIRRITKPPVDCSIAAVARRRGISPEALAYDMLLEDDGRRMLFVATTNYFDKSLDAT